MQIAVIPGDGIGPEVISQGVNVLEAVADKLGLDLEFEFFPYGADHYLKTGNLLTDQDLDQLSGFDAIYLGAVGDPRVPPGILEKGILLKIRFHFDQYVNLRPVKLLDPSLSILSSNKPINFYVVRENTEDLYVDLSSRIPQGRSRIRHRLQRAGYSLELDLDLESTTELCYQIGIISKQAAERVIEYAFQLARSRKLSKVCCVDKSNVMEMYSYWRECFHRIASRYPEIQPDYMYVDAAAMWMIKNPESFQVMVTPNMFGDILTDLGAVLQGGLGMAPSANINPRGICMFEPVHGSAPKYKGMNIANPMASILAGGLMLEHLGYPQASGMIEEAIKQVLRAGIKTRDLGGNSTTAQVGQAIAQRIKSMDPAQFS